jgi:hypothetical protein
VVEGVDSSMKYLIYYKSLCKHHNVLLLSTTIKISFILSFLFIFMTKISIDFHQLPCSLDLYVTNCFYYKLCGKNNLLSPISITLGALSSLDDYFWWLNEDNFCCILFTCPLPIYTPTMNSDHVPDFGKILQWCFFCNIIKYTHSFKKSNFYVIMYCKIFNILCDGKNKIYNSKVFEVIQSLKTLFLFLFCQISISMEHHPEPFFSVKNWRYWSRIKSDML